MIESNDINLECTRSTYLDKDRVHLTVYMDKSMALETIRKLTVGMQNGENKEYQFSAFGKRIKDES